MREFRKQLKARVWRWRIWVDRNDIHTELGYLDGKLEHFISSESSKYRGEKGEIDANTVAATKATKMIRQKLQSGFEEVDPKTGKPLGDEEKAHFERWDTLPKSFRIYHKLPLDETQRYNNDHFRTLINSNQYILYVLPYGRQFTFMIAADGRPKAYSRRGEHFSPYVPHLISALDQAKLPPKTLFTAYLTTGFPEKDRLLFLSKTADAMVGRQTAPTNRLWAVMDNILFWDGEDVVTGMTWKRSHDLWRRLWPYPPYFDFNRPLTHNFDDAKRHVHNYDFPGLLIYDGLAIPDTAHCYNFHGSGPYGKVWVWRRPTVAEFYLFYHPSMGGRTGVVHRRNRSDELCLGKVGLFQAGPDGEPLCFGTVRHGFSREMEEAVLTLAKRTGGWVGKALVRYRGHHEAMHSGVVSRLIDPYFLHFLPEDAQLASYRRQGLVPDLGTPQAKEQRVPCLSATPTSSPLSTDPEPPSKGNQ